MRTPFLKNRCFMKKRYIAIGAAVLVIVLVVIGIVVINHFNTPADTTPENPANAQVDITVDSWLKIAGYDDYYGKLAIVVENVGDTDVEYAVLNAKNKSGDPLTFTVSALLKGSKAVLLCNQDVSLDYNEAYTGWEITDKILFENPPTMNDDKLEITLAKGSIGIKNISDEDIESDIIIYYKDKKDDVLNGSATYRTRIAGLKADSQTFVKAEDLNEENCQIIFTEYDD